MQYSTKEEKIKIFQHILSLWKGHVCSTIVPIKLGHTCTPFEDRHKKVRKVEKDGRFLVDDDRRGKDACTIENISTVVYVKADGAIHMCIKGFCDKSDKLLHHKMLYHIDDIFFCHTGGTDHFCGDLCNLSPELNKDREYVCKISGKTTGKVEVVHDVIDNFRAMQKQNDAEDQSDNNPTETQNVFQDNKKKKKKNDTINPMELDIILYNAMNGKVSDIKTKFSTKKMVKESYRATAIDLIASSLVKQKKMSKDGFNSNREKEELYALFKKYVGKKNQLHQKTTSKMGPDTKQIHFNVLPNVFDLEMIANNYRLKKPYGIDISRLNQDQIKSISMFYSVRCMSLWYILKTKTGKNAKQFNQWNEFIRASMLVFQEGINISAKDTGGSNMLVIQPDPFLSFLKGSLDMSFTTEHSSTRSKKNNSTKIRSDILRCIYEAIHNEHRNPKEFCLDDVSYEDMDENVFDKITITH